MSEISEYKNLQIINLINKFNIESVEKKKNEFWIKAPWRNEKTASVKCSMNLWYDFGEGCGGNIFDFVMKYKDCDFREALRFLRAEFDSSSFEQQNRVNPKSSKKSYTIELVQELINPILIDYLQSRNLNLEICKRFLHEIYYKVNGKKYFGVAFKNRSAGYEVRNKYAKLCLGKKDYTYFKNNCKRLIVIESWSDYISLLTLFPQTEKKYDFVVLNSLSMLSKLNNVFNEYDQILFALDNDKAGINATEKHAALFLGKINDISYIYKNEYKDLNDYLISCK